MSLTETQLAARRIGGSDMPCLFGLVPKSPYTLWQEKLKLIEPQDLEDIEHVRFGTLMEPVIAAEYERRECVKLYNPQKTKVNPKYPFLTGHADRLIRGQRKGVECKNTGQFAAGWGDDDSDEAAPHAAIQAHTYMLIYDYEAWDVVRLRGGNRLFIYRLRRDPRMDERIIETAAAFWKCVETQTPPPIMNLDDARARWPVSVENCVEATTEIHLHSAHLQGLKVQIKVLETERDESAKAIIEHMGEADTLTYEGLPIMTYRTQSANRLNMDRLKKERADIYEEFAETSTSRVLRAAKQANKGTK